jgi:hypothetical protein
MTLSDTQHSVLKELKTIIRKIYLAFFVVLSASQH